MTVERMKRTIWASLLKINDAIIIAATSGNLRPPKSCFILPASTRSRIPTKKKTQRRQPCRVRRVPVAPVAGARASASNRLVLQAALGSSPHATEPESEVA